MVNAGGEWLAGGLTAGNAGDRSPVPHLVKRVLGKLFGDQGYWWQTLFAHRFEQGIQWVTKIGANRTNRLLRRRRASLGSIYDRLKHRSQIEHTRQRSLAHFRVNRVAGRMAYCPQPTQPALHLAEQPLLEAIA